MPKYLFAYHGGGAPKTEEAQAQAMAAWGQWMETHAAAFADMGAPVGKSSTVSKDGIVDHGGANPLSGYSIVEAGDLAAAHAIAAGCPMVVDGSGSVEVAEIIPMS